MASTSNGKTATARYPALTAEQEAKVTELITLMTRTYDPLPPPLLALQRYTPSKADKAGEDGSAATNTFFSPIRNYCYCFLVSREWDVQRALEMMQLSVSYREKNKLDTRAELPSAVCCRGWDQEAVREALEKPTRPTDQRLDRLSASIAPYFSFGLHYWDKHGQPVLYMNLGSVDEPGLLKRLKQLANVGQTPDAVIWELVQHLLGVQEQILFYQQMQYTAGTLAAQAQDGLIRSATIVIDLKGLTYKMLWKPALDLFMNALKSVFQHYPQCVYQILLVNSPAMVTFAYKIVRGALPLGVQKKVHIANVADTPATMRTYIDTQHVPDYLGGACHCEGGCIRGYDPDRKSKASEDEAGKSDTASNQSTGHKDDAAGVTTEDIALKAGQELKRAFALKTGESVVWEFVSASGRDVAFTTFFVPAAEARGMDAAKLHTSKLEPFTVSKGNPSEGSDEYTADGDGLLVLVWDNKKSWFTAKHLQMKVFKQAAPVTGAEQ
ncbi:CRAL/TRIO domain containing protein [Novymonas esmeraldas]|uniref:CRAL/TRIO domain containing protein n=1 Tax=Novymonas esmeraldas TaxID=1808958 RepID=A0AAW0EYR7_9TRYP